MAASPSMMASDAAAGMIDPNRQGRFSMHLADELLNPNSSTTVFSAVSFNHKPRLSQAGSRSTKLTSTDRRDVSSLTITDIEGRKKSVYSYSGRKRTSKRSFVLTFDAAKQSCTLHPLTASYAFNLQSTPDQTSASKLSELYPQIHDKSEQSSEDESDDVDDHGLDGEPDTSNPFDFRHYLHSTKPRSRSPTPNPPTPGLSGSKSRDRASSAPDPQTNKRKTAQSASKQHQQQKQQQQKQQQQQQQQQRQGQKSQQKKQQPTPTVRLDRRASTRPIEDEKPVKKAAKAGNELKLSPPKTDGFAYTPTSTNSSLSKPVSSPAAPLPGSESGEEEDEDDDDFPVMGSGGLEIDFGDSPPPSSKRRRALTLPNSSHAGPISLRSAANSPGSQVHSPKNRRGRLGDKVVISLRDVADFDEEDAEDESEDERYERTNQKKGKTHSDEDVEPISLGPPAHDLANNDADMDGDLDAAFEAEMMQGLASEDNDYGMPLDPAPPPESESESEAE